MITHLEPDILECEVMWALESITTNKASRGDGIPVELFQILKDDAVKLLHSICQHIWKTQQWPQDWKRSVFIPIPKKGLHSFPSKEKVSFNFMAAVTISCTTHILFSSLSLLLSLLSSFTRLYLRMTHTGIYKLILCCHS